MIINLESFLQTYKNVWPLLFGIKGWDSVAVISRMTRPLLWPTEKLWTPARYLDALSLWTMIHVEIRKFHDVGETPQWGYIGDKQLLVIVIGRRLFICSASWQSSRELLSESCPWIIMLFLSIWDIYWFIILGTFSVVLVLYESKGNRQMILWLPTDLM